MIHSSFRKLSKLLQDIEKGNHNDYWCERYRKYYKRSFEQELPDCQFKGNKTKIKNLIRKHQIDPYGNVTEETTSFLTKMKKLFRRK